MKKVVYHACSKSSELCAKCAYMHNTGKMLNWRDDLIFIIKRVIDILEDQAHHNCIFYNPNFLSAIAKELQQKICPWD